MVVLVFVWLALILLNLTRGLSPTLSTLSNIVWALFVFDFALDLVITPSKLAYLRRNWLTRSNSPPARLRAYSMLVPRPCGAASMLPP